MFIGSPDALVPFGWSERVAGFFDGVDHPGCQPGRAVRVERACSLVVCADGIEHFLAAPGPVAVGDWVAATDTAIQAVLPRWSALTRTGPSGMVQVLAANVDVVIITAPAERLSPARIERELMLAWESGARPLVALTKADMAPDGLLEDLQARLLGAEVVAVSSLSGQGLEHLRAALQPARTAVLFGASGAGKSTLANALLGTDLLETAAVRGGDHSGRHTTTSRQLVALEGGGVLIDTPGLRSLGLNGGDDLEQVFPEIEALSASCRFADCRHGAEPGCAVTAAVSSGKLHPARLTSFHKLARDVANERRRIDPSEQRLERQLWKKQTKQAKQARANRRPNG